jgi:hypothetical protein
MDLNTSFYLSPTREQHLNNETFDSTLANLLKKNLKRATPTPNNSSKKAKNIADKVIFIFLML